MANPNPEPHPENLKPIQPGEVRNPNGSSNKQRLTNALIALLESQDISKLPPRIRKFVVTGYIQATCEADFNFWREVFNRVDGKLPEPTGPEPPVTMEEIAKRLRERKAAKKKKRAE